MVICVFGVEGKRDDNMERENNSKRLGDRGDGLVDEGWIKGRGRIRWCMDKGE